MGTMPRASVTVKRVLQDQLAHTLLSLAAATAKVNASKPVTACATKVSLAPVARSSSALRDAVIMANASTPLACVMMVSRELGASCPSALLIALATGNARMVAFALAKRASVALDAAASAAPLTALATASASTAPAFATRASAVSHALTRHASMIAVGLVSASRASATASRVGLVLGVSSRLAPRTAVTTVHASMALAPPDGLVATAQAKRAPKTALATVHARMVFVHACGRTLGRLAMTTTAVLAPLCAAPTVALQNAVPPRPRA